MTKRFSVLAVSAAVIGGFMLTAVPAQAATAGAQGDVSVTAAITCEPDQMREEIRKLKDKAAKLEQLQEYAAARKARKEAAALQKKLEACLAADDGAGKPFPG